VRLRSCILLLLIGHVLVHPMVHGFCSTPVPAPGTVTTLPQNSSSSASSLDNCDLCRASQSTMLWSGLPEIERWSPQWVSVRLQAVSYASLRVENQLPARAPPSL
jgi:hypothetical protein